MDHPPDTTSLLHHFAALKDPRQRIKVVYPLPEIVLLVLCATIVGADDFVEINHWGEIHTDFLRRFLPYKHGIPSHDAMTDLMNALNPRLFSECFVTWVSGLRDSDPDIVAIDGKTSRRTHAKSKGRQPLHLVSAWASRQRLVLGQEATDIKSNEITAIPLLLQRLELKGALVTIYAMGCQTKIAATILDRGADYLLAVKDNQPTLLDDIERYFADTPAEELQTFQTTRACPCEGGGRPWPHRSPPPCRQPQRQLAYQGQPFPRHQIHRHGREPGRTQRPNLMRTSLLYLLSAPAGRAVRQRRPLPLAHREPPALGAGCHFP